MANQIAAIFRAWCCCSVILLAMILILAADGTADSVQWLSPYTSSLS
ncbi:hypothetical protein SSYIS1_14240 [Serratia symbiotica]|uniref:Uncharacterized protein n=1 Tax=Serratia symbiotica TaxID=138074 RepID=A0A455VMP5_9GAMM|nr:hypothetical protein SSYIS1_14240 [Serratia symbiotica]